MAKLIDTYTTEDGHEIAVYESGAEYDRTAGRLVRPAAATVIRDGAKATDFNRRRQEKAAARLRDRIVAAARNGLPPGTLVRSSADAFAESGAMLFEQVVLESEAYPRDRIEAWEKLGKYSGVLPADVRQPAADPAAARLTAAAAAAGAEAARLIARVLADVAARQADRPADVVDVAAVAVPPLPDRTGLDGEE